MFLTRRSESHLDFDLDVAKSQSLDNPVYYVQYAHARVASIHRKADENKVETPPLDRAALDRLAEPEELNILKTLAQFPEFIGSAAEALEPHRLTYYLTDLSSSFHNYYNRHRVLTDDPELTGARLVLADAVQQVIRNGLGILGVSAPLPDGPGRNGLAPTQGGIFGQAVRLHTEAPADAGQPQKPDPGGPGRASPGGLGFCAEA